MQDLLEVFCSALLSAWLLAAAKSCDALEGLRPWFPRAEQAAQTHRERKPKAGSFPCVTDVRQLR